jgi:hypothetical protein
MRPRFQADENFNAKVVTGLLRREPSIDFQTAKAGGIIGRPDPEVLMIATRGGRVLVSHDRDTMPAHFSRFIIRTRSSGLLIVSPRLDMGEAIEQLLLVWAATDESEWVNAIGYLPL